MRQNLDSTPLRVLHVTDTHLFEDPAGTLAGVETERACLDVLSHVREYAGPIDLILLTGDLVHDRSTVAYQRLRERMAEFHVPVLVLPGNHDDRDLMRQIYRAPPVQWVFEARFGSWLIISLDSSVPGKPGGRLQTDELERLDKLLERSPEANVLICLHHQPVATGSEWLDRIGVGNGDALLELCARHPGVRAIVWGHVHQDVDRRLGRVRLLATPSTCVQFRPGGQTFGLDAIPPGYRMLALHADGRVDSRLYRLPTLPDGLEVETSGY